MRGDTNEWIVTPYHCVDDGEGEVGQDSRDCWFARGLSRDRSHRDHREQGTDGEGSGGGDGPSSPCWISGVLREEQRGGGFHLSIGRCLSRLSGGGGESVQRFAYIDGVSSRSS